MDSGFIFQTSCHQNLIGFSKLVVGCARGQEQTTRKNVVLTFDLVDEIHKTLVLSFENVVMQCLRAITQTEPAK